MYLSQIYNQIYQNGVLLKILRVESLNIVLKRVIVALRKKVQLNLINMPKFTAQILQSEVYLELTKKFYSSSKNKKLRRGKTM